MASLSTDPKGHRMIQFMAADGKRRTIRLGKVSRRQSESVKVRVERLVAAQLTGHAVDDETARWISDLDRQMAEKLARVGLIPEVEKMCLGPFWDRYFSSRQDVKPATLTVWRHTRRNLTDFFGEDRTLKSITRGDAEEWRLSLVTGGLAESTIRKRCGFAKQFMATAVKHELISSNPFEDLKSGAVANPSRYYFVTRQEADRVLEACPDAEWRLLFALSRYGGLRCPSEHLALRWEDVDWDRSRITVRSPKTEHHPGGESRVMPLFPELLPHLELCFDQAEPGEEFVITRYRRPNSNLRTLLMKIIRRAGLQPWPKLFQNLRSTRETELADQFPIQVVCDWIGNTEAVAAKHYLQVTEDHFTKALQNALQHPAVLPRTGSQADLSAHEKTPVLQGFAAGCEVVQSGRVEDRGLEPLTFWLPARRSPN